MSKPENRCGGEGLTFEALCGAEALAVADDLARLRITVFREWPYLYEGDVEYEKEYLRGYFAEPRSVFVVARDGERIVGVSTGTPLRAEPVTVQQAFEGSDYSADEVFYLGESVLLSEYRGQGAGVRFFQEREAHARRLGGFRWCAFCAVVRPEDHPARPSGFVPLDHFWGNRGYKRTDLTTVFTWREIGGIEEVPNEMRFWVKEIGSQF